MLNRRGFITSLLASAVLDPERLLWVPGKKMISIPKPSPKLILRAGDRIAVKWGANNTLSRLAIVSLRLEDKKIVTVAANIQDAHGEVEWEIYDALR